MELNGKKINFLGDSITEGCCASRPELGYVNVMKSRYQLSEARNYGIGGTRIARQRIPSAEPKYDLDFCQRAARMDPDVDIIVVFGGTNDHGHGDAPFGVSSDQTPDTFHGACSFLFTTLKERFPEALIVVLTPLQRSDGDIEKPGSGRKLKDYAAVIKNTAVSCRLPVLDLFETSYINKRLDALTTDGLHPNDEGHAILAQEIGTFLLQL